MTDIKQKKKKLKQEKLWIKKKKILNSKIKSWLSKNPQRNVLKKQKKCWKPKKKKNFKMTIFESFDLTELRDRKPKLGG